MPRVEQENRRREINSQLGQMRLSRSPRDRRCGDLETPLAHRLQRDERGGITAAWKKIGIATLPCIIRIVDGLLDPALAESSLHHSRRDHIPAASGGHK